MPTRLATANADALPNQRPINRCIPCPARTRLARVAPMPLQPSRPAIPGQPADAPHPRFGAGKAVRADHSRAAAWSQVRLSAIAASPGLATCFGPNPVDPWHTGRPNGHHAGGALFARHAGGALFARHAEAYV